MKPVTKKVKEKNKTIDDLAEELQALKRHLYAECNECDGTGKYKADSGKPSKNGTEDSRCATCYGTGMRKNRIEMIEKSIENIKTEVSRISSNLKIHVNKQSVEIRVLPEGGDVKNISDWEDYSGAFDLDGDEETSIIIGKARNHFDTYFKDGFYHRNKKLGIFLTNPRSGKQLIEQMETEE